jgi:hypothetical protein
MESIRIKLFYILNIIKNTFNRRITKSYIEYFT